MAEMDDFVASFIESAHLGRREQAGDLLFKIERRLEDDEDDDLTGDQLQSVVRTLIDERYFPEAESFLETMAMANRLAPVNHLDRAQVQIEQGRQAYSIPVLEVLAERFKDDGILFAEAKGIAGRAHKDLFLRALRGNRAAAVEHLNQALARYNEGRDGAEEKRNWLAGNLLSLGTRAEVEGIRPTIDIDLDEIANSIEETTSRIPEADRKLYDWSSLAEARIFKRDWDGASKAVNEILKAKDDDVFKLNSTLRQFKDVWQLQNLSEQAGHLITGMERRILEKPNGEISLNAEDIKRQRRTREEDLEGQFSHHMLRGRDWMQRFLQLGDSVASVVGRSTGAVKGTCCIIDGGQIAPEFEGQLLGLTNDHVISEFPKMYTQSRPLSPRDAAVRFTLSDDPKRHYAIDSVLWSSPFDAHDACLFNFKDALPISRSSLTIVDYLPPAPNTPPSEVFVISHPNPDEPSYSFQNTALLMHDGETRGEGTVHPGFIHYSTGTIKGSSGGVALNAMLEMIGLHHAGSETMDRIDGVDETHEANEAIWIHAIVNAIVKSLDLKVTRWKPEYGAED